METRDGEEGSESGLIVQIGPFKKRLTGEVT